MIKTVGLLLFSAVLVAMVQPFDSRSTIDLAVLDEEVLAALGSQQQVLMPSVERSIKSEMGGLYPVLGDGLRVANVSVSVNQATINVNAPVVRSYFVNYIDYNKPDEIDQPIQDLNEQDPTSKLVLAGLDII
jgi:hypothetical protein